MNNETPYEVGYRKPPKAAQFKRGRSGNPKGRPPMTSEDGLDVKLLLEGPVPVSRGGVKTKMPAFEVTLRSLAKKALQDGHFGAAMTFLDFCGRAELIPVQAELRSGGAVVVPNDMRWKEWVDKFRRLGPPPWPDGDHSGLPGGSRKPKKGPQ